MKKVLHFVFTVFGMIFLWGLFSPMVNGQITQTVRGLVVDHFSQRKLTGVHVFLKGPDTLATVTDDVGTFTFKNVSTGTYDLSFQYVGYKLLEIKQIEVSPSRGADLLVQLEEAPFMLDSIRVIVKKRDDAPVNPAAIVSSRSLSVEAMNRNAANFADPGRMALSFPGVAPGTDDLTNEIIVRGNAPGGLLWRLEGIEIPNPNHFPELGSSGGGITMLSTNMLARSDFLSGAFPAEYGNALSGVLDLRLRQGSIEQRVSSVQLGLLGINLSTEGPVHMGTSKASYLANYRYSTLGLLEKIGFNVGRQLIPDFQDLAFKIGVDTKKSGRFALFGLGGQAVNKDEGAEFNENILEKERGRTAILGLTHQYNASKKVLLKTTLLFSNIANLFELSTSEVTTSDYQIRRIHQFNEAALRTAFSLNINLSEKSHLKIGSVFSWMDHQLQFEEEDFLIRMPAPRMIRREWLGTWNTPLDNEGQVPLMQFFVQSRHYLSADLLIDFGMHTTHFGLNKEWVFEPRLGLKYWIKDHTSLALAVGRHSRVNPVALNFIQKTDEFTGDLLFPNNELKLSKAGHYVLSLTHSFSKFWHITFEAYYQSLFDLPLSAHFDGNISLINEQFSRILRENLELVSNGKGRNYGIEWNVKRNWQDGYYFEGGGSVFKSKFQNLHGQWFPTRYDRTFSLFAVGGKELMLGGTGSRSLGVNGKMLFLGGLKYTPIDEEASLSKEESILSKDLYSAALPAYFRIDLGFFYKIFGTSTVHLLTLDIQNLLDTQNVFEYNEFYNERTGRIDRREQFYTGLTPVLAYRIEF